MTEIKSTEPRLGPIRRSVVVRQAPEEAFVLFTERISSWWPLWRHSLYQAESAGVTIDPKVGGRVEEVSKKGDRAHWGTVRAWEPPNRIVVTWHPGTDPGAPTEVEIRFVPVPEGTRVELEHRDWVKLGARAEEARGSYDQGWIYVLDCFVEGSAKA